MMDSRRLTTWRRQERHAALSSRESLILLTSRRQEFSRRLIRAEDEAAISYPSSRDSASFSPISSAIHLPARSRSVVNGRRFRIGLESRMAKCVQPPPPVPLGKRWRRRQRRREGHIEIGRRSAPAPYNYAECQISGVCRPCSWTARLYSEIIRGERDEASPSNGTQGVCTPETEARREGAEDFLGELAEELTGVCSQRKIWAS